MLAWLPVGTAKALTILDCTCDTVQIPGLWHPKVRVSRACAMSRPLLQWARANRAAAVGAGWFGTAGMESA